MSRRSYWGWGLESDEPTEQQRIDYAKKLSERHGVTQADAIELAVQLMLDDYARERREARSAGLAATFGMWKDRGIDTDTYLSDLRSEWERTPEASE